MTKTEELTNPQSCLNRAAPNEPVFVLRAKDPAAVSAIIHWIDERLRTGKSKGGDSEIVDAFDWLNRAEHWRATQLTDEV